MQFLYYPDIQARSPESEAQGSGKFVFLSPRMIYGRGFQPGGGMFYDQALKLAKDIGACPDALLPSDNKDEASMQYLGDERESDRIAGKIYRGGNFLYLAKNIVEAHGGTMSFISKENEGTTFAFKLSIK